MPPILQKDNPVLREKAKTVPLSDIATPRIQNIIADMKTALDSQDDGVAIAAPQIGQSLRIFLISGKVLSRAQQLEQPIDDIVCINPKILKASKDKKLMEEGCLSVSYLYGKVRRSSRIVAEYVDIHGTVHTIEARSLMAQIFQHEIDHLDGILFIDKAKNTKEIAPEKRQR